MPSITTTLLILTIVFILLPTETNAFGAGDIPDFSYLNGKAFRHGDIESILEELAKTAGFAAGGGLLGLASSILKQASGGAKFSKSDVKRVYFGNWLRDYSQAMDIAGLSKLTADTIVLVVGVLGFMTFGFATQEFEVTADRLGVYLPVEHIDNPKGYAAKEGDARRFHPKLRPPVSDRELEFDERTGMKKYMATEDEGFDSSTAFIRRTLRACIEHGRRSGGQDGSELFEAYRLLGTGLHTLEDLLAHSNWCEIALRKLGHEEVFCHVGDNVRINTPQGEAPPIVTGTFGGADFLHSLLGEAGDKLSQASVTDLSDKMNSASQDSDTKMQALSAILKKLPVGGGDEKVNQGAEMQAQAKAYNFDPNNVAPPEVQKRLWDLLKWRDQVYRDVVEKIEMVPGLADLIDDLTNALNAYVFTVLAPYLTPILQQTTGILSEGSKAVIDSDDQFAVFNDPNASDPSHSILSKDHFALILNEPAGKIAQVVVEHTVSLIVKAWADDSNPDEVLDAVLEAFHHPYYATGQSNIQHSMLEKLQEWFGGLGPDMEAQVIDALSKESVRNGKNKRIGMENEEIVEPGYQRESHGGAASQFSGGYGGGHSSYGEESQPSGGRYGGDQDSSYRRGEGSYGSGGGYGGDQNSSYRRGDEAYGSGGGYGRPHKSSGQREESYGSGYGENRHQQSSYDQENRYQRDEEDRYSSRRNEGYGGREEAYGFRRQDEDSNREEHGRRRHEEYESRDEYSVTQSSFNSRRHGGENDQYGSGMDTYRGDDSGYGGNREGHTSGYGRDEYGARDEDQSDRHGRGYQPSYGQSSEEYGGGYSGRSHGGYGGDEDQSSAYRGGRYGGEEESSGYEGRHGRRHGNESEESSGYAPAYGRSDDTFGAERMNLNDEGESYSGGHRYRSYEENDGNY